MAGAVTGGRIARVETVNFKSYGGKTVIGPFRNFSAVIGPNGAGKSNLMDALSFVVGVNSKDLRGKQLKDLIYRSTTDKGDEERAASVTLVFERGGKETAFRRSITSAGVGKFHIDGKGMTADAYHARLRAEGILSKAHTGFLVFQGYVSELAAKSPHELTALFEQISGSDEHKEDYERLEREKTKAEDELSYAYQKKKLLLQERTNVRKQKEEAEKYALLQEGVREKKRRLELLRLFHLEQEVAERREEVLACRREAEEVEGRHALVEDQVRTQEVEKAKQGSLVVKLERKAVALAQDVDGRSPEQIRLQEEIGHLTKRRGMGAKSLEKLEKQQRDSEQQMGTLRAELKEIGRERKRLEDESAAADEAGDLEMSEQRRAEYNALKAQAGTRTAAMAEELARKRRELRDLEPTLLQARTKLEQVSGEQRQGDAKLAALDQRQGSSREAAQAADAELRALAAEESELGRSVAAARARREALGAELAELEGRLRSSKADHRESERERRSAEAVQKLMRLYPGVLGRMTDVCKPTKSAYRTAVTVAMGKHMDAVVVDEEKTAIECIHYLKEQKCAPETFIPLDGVRVRPARDALRQLGGTKLLVQDVVATQDERFKTAVFFAVGDTIVCDSWQEAQQLAFHSGGGERYKVVTKDGTLINKAGLITGGSSQGDKDRAAKWDRAPQSRKDLKEHDEMKRQYQSLLAELDGLDSLASADEREMVLRERLATKRHEAQTAHADLELTRTKIAKLTDEHKVTTKAAEKAAKELRAHEAAHAKLGAEVEALEAARAEEEDRIFADFSRSVGVASVREYEETSLKRAREREEQLLALRQQESKLQARLAFEERKALPAAAKKLRDSIAKDDKELAGKSDQLEKVKRKADEKREEAAKAEADAKDAKDAKAAAETALKSLKKEMRAAADQLAAARAKAASAAQALDEHREQRQRTFARARLAELELPVLPAVDDDDDGGGTTAATAVAAGAAGKKPKRKRTAAAAGEPFAASELVASEPFSASALVGTGTLEGDDGDESDEVGEATGGSAGAGSSGATGAGGGGDVDLVRLDFSSLDAAERAAAPASFEKALGGEIAELARQIEGMAPNMKAIEQYEEVQSRLSAMETEYDQTRAQHKEASQEFAAVQQKRHKLFMACFKAVSEGIDDKYKDLTQTEGVLVGGTAYLSLEDTAQPYLHGIKYTAMPPGKRFRDMEQLSGGERTVAALALLFAIWEFRPSPFFVMDEIDAALDNVNVTRVAQYIRERAQDGALQFIVISLKDQFYHMAHSLVGIYRDRSDESSDVATLDLESLEQPPPPPPRRSSTASIRASLSK